MSLKSEEFFVESIPVKRCKIVRTKVSVEQIPSKESTMPSGPKLSLFFDQIPDGLESVPREYLDDFFNSIVVFLQKVSLSFYGINVTGVT